MRVVAGDAALGTRDVSVTTPKGTGMLIDGFTVTTQAPMANFEPATGPVGISIDVTGTGWTASENIISVTVGTVAATNTLSVDADGNLSGTITVPDGLLPGDKDIVIEGMNSGTQTFPNAFTVTT